MPDIVDFPGGLAFGDRVDPQLVANTRTGGVSINGFEQIVSPLSQRWEWTVSIPVHRAHKARGLRAFMAKMKGRFNYARIRMCDQYRMNRREMGAVPGFVRGRSVPHSDGAYFSDGSGYEMAHGTTPLSTPPVRGQTKISADTNFLVIPGVFFSINQWLYVVTDVDDDGAISFQPPLREDGGEEIDWDATCLWQLATDRTGTMSLQQGRFGTAVLNFVEPVGR